MPLLAYKRSLARSPLHVHVWFTHEGRDAHALHRTQPGTAITMQHMQQHCEIKTKTHAHEKDAVAWTAAQIEAHKILGSLNRNVKNTPKKANKRMIHCSCPFQTGCGSSSWAQLLREMMLQLNVTQLLFPRYGCGEAASLNVSPLTRLYGSWLGSVNKVLYLNVRIKSD